MRQYTIRFSTDLNESMKITIKARSYKEAIRKIKIAYPSAYDFD